MAHASQITSKIKTITMLNNDITLYQINNSNKKGHIELFDLKKAMYESFLKYLFPKEIYDYLSYFLNIETIKDKMNFDNHTFYLIKLKEKTAGFFEYKLIPNALIILNIFLLKENRNNKIGSFCFDFLKNEAKNKGINKIYSPIYKDNKTAQEFFKYLGFHKHDEKAKYLGSDIYIFEDIFEYDI